jgi:hypothetical protein
MASDKPSKSDARPRPKQSGKRKPSAKEQSERFMETARQLESDETGKAFERAVSAVMQVRSEERRKR